MTSALELQADSSLPMHSDQLRGLLEFIAGSLPLHLACVYTYYRHLRRLEPAAEYAAAPVSAGAFARLRRLLEDLDGAVSTPLTLLDADTLAGTGFQSGLVFGLMMDDAEHTPVGLLAIFSDLPGAYTPADALAVQPWVDLARALVENRYLRENQAAARAIQAAAHIIGDEPSPQHLVNVLHDHLCSPHVALCVLMFYGPLEENRLNGPFDYLEVQGSWLRSHGEGVGVGIRFYLDQYADLLAELDTHRMLTFTSIKPLKSRLDPLVRAFMRAERVHSLTFIALHAPPRRLGVIAIATDRPHQFSPLELDNYRAVSEFLAVGAMARVLRRQHDLVQRGRSAMLDAVTDGVMMVLPHPLHPHVLTVNECFTRMFRIGQPAAAGLSLTRMLERMQLPDDTRQELRRRWLSIPVGDTAVQRGEFGMMHPDGFPVTIVWYSAPVYHENRVMGRIYTFHDVSAERTSALLRANFISWVSHELRTPLTSIRGFAQFILEAAGDELPALAREYTGIILESAIHLNRVVSDIIEIARADTGQLKLTIEEAHLPDIITHAAARLAPQFQARGQTLDMRFEDSLPGVRADSSRIGQALTNLLTNAIQYAPADSAIHISARHVSAPRDLPGGAPQDVVLPGILVTVADEGAGIPAEETEQVFLPFFRAGQTRASKITGTGLGLTTARSFIELHQGKIWAEPRRRGKRGAVFHFTLPAARP